MLETGKTCMCCDKKKYLKDINQSTNICWRCEKDNRDYDDGEQFRMSLKFDKGDPNISNCKCGRYFDNKLNRRVRCDICRNGGKEPYTTQVRGGLQKGSRSARKGTVKEVVIDNGTLNQSKQNKIDLKNKEKDIIKTQKNITVKEQREGEGTVKNTTNTKESIIEKTVNESENKLEKVDSGETHSTDIQYLSNNLKTENSSSMNLLNESVTLLTTSAKAMLQGNKGDFGDGVIRKPTVQEAELALKLTLGANELMKTKLDYITTGRNLVKDLRDLK